jgi:hypothetical protein
MRILQLLRCATGNHVPSHRRSHRVDGRKESVCRGCGRKMVREDLAGQLVADSAPTPISVTEL